MTEKRPSLCVLIPCYLTVPVLAYQKIITFMATVARYYDAGVSTSSSCYLFENRNMLVKRFADTDSERHWDYVLWLDSDIVFTIDDVLLLQKALDEGRDLVTGVYFNNFGNDLAPMVMHKDDTGNFRGVVVSELLKGKIFPVDSAGFGFVMMKGDVMRKMIENNPLALKHRVFKYRENDKGELEGEDNCFFEDAKEQGFQLYVVPMAKVGHNKQVIL